MHCIDKISVDQCDIVSDSSGVGTSNSGSNGSYDANTPSEHSLVLPGMTVVCTEAYSSKEANHLNLQPGDIIEGEPVTKSYFSRNTPYNQRIFFVPPLYPVSLKMCNVVLVNTV